MRSEVRDQRTGKDRGRRADPQINGRKKAQKGSKVGDVADRLFGSLQVDSSKAWDLLGWKPVVPVDEALKETAEAYLEDG